MPRGTLTVVGTGISIGRQLTPEAAQAIAEADVLLHLASDPLADRWLDTLHPDAHSLASHYRVGVERYAIYEAIVGAIMEPVRAGRAVCAAFYGHPGVFVRPSHLAIARARAEGHDAHMLPGVSAEDCLYADLGVDPGDGCASYDATHFLEAPRSFDPSAALILWQLSVVGDSKARAAPNTAMLAPLVERLRERYPGTHEVVLYEASPYPGVQPIVERLPLERLAEAAITPMSTLYVPPLAG